MSIEVIELGKDGTYTTMPEPGDTPASSGEGQDAAPSPQTGVPADNGASAPPPAPSAEDASLAASPEPADGDEPDAPAETPITAGYVNRKISRLTAKQREAERALEAEQQARAQERAELLGRLDTLTRVLSGSAPAMPDAPPQPTGPPSAEQYADHETYDQAAARYQAEQVMRERDQREQQMRFQQDLMSREQTFKAQHPDFDQVVRTGLAGKVSPVLQQALMLVPDGPAVAYTLAQQGATVIDANGQTMLQRLNGLPPPLVLVELGRLSQPAQPPANLAPAVGSTNGTTQPPATPLPEPMAPVGGGGSMVQPTYTENMSQREYEQWRQRTSQLPYLRRG